MLIFQNKLRLGKLLFVSLFLTLFIACNGPSTPTPDTEVVDAAAPKVTVYADANFKGKKTDLKKLGIFAGKDALGKDVTGQISSIKVGIGLRAIACEKENGGGKCATFMSGQEVSDLSAMGFDNLISSITIEEGPIVPDSLKTVEVPEVKDLNKFVKDKDLAIVLGKAFFWDQAAGSDGQACASCHFHAGADNRIKNQVSPGLNAGDDKFNTTASGAKSGPNYTVKEADFPFHQFNDPNNPYSGVKFTTNDTLSSQGVHNGMFKNVPDADTTFDECEWSPDPIFHVNGLGTRRVEPRNTPSMINAVFNFRNFWDGRANNIFNGVDPFGNRSENARVFKDSDLKVEQIELSNSSLASQASSPPTSDLEMSCRDRKFAEIGRKLLERQPLALQEVHPQDSVLGAYRDNDGHGLKISYEQLIQDSFNDKYWKSDQTQDGFNQMELNFSLFWGLALQLYQTTLISDEAPFDDWAEGQSSALSEQAKRGMSIFFNQGKCANCHKGSEFSSAASVLQQEFQEKGLIERMLMSDGGVALYDDGFYNIGVTPTPQDIGVGGKDPFGNPLSFSRQYIMSMLIDPFEVDPCTFIVPFNDKKCKEEPSPQALKNERVAVDGAFKVPILRNVELTGPYFHNGGIATLEQVVQFYNRGGNFRNPEKDPDIQPLGLSSSQQADLVAFLKALTDERVRLEKAPFDHPQLFIPNGHSGDQYQVKSGAFGQTNMALDDWLEVPAIGKNGRNAEGLAPLRPFEWVLQNGGPDLRKASFPGLATPPSPSPAVTNLLLNSDFEAGISDWSSGDTNSSISSDAKTGSKALQMTAYGWLQQNLKASDLIAGKTYTLVVSAKSLTGQSCTVGLAGGGSSSVSASLSFSSSAYSQKSLEQVLPSGIDWAAVYLSSASGTCLFDALTLSSK